MDVCNYKLYRVNPILQQMPPPCPPLPPPIPSGCSPSASWITPSLHPSIQVQNIPEVSHHMRRLAGGMLLQPGAHHVVDAVCELGSHRRDIAVSDRQDSISQEEPERGQDIALDSLGFPGINRSYKHCQVRETSILTTWMQTSTYLYFWFLEAFSG